MRKERAKERPDARKLLTTPDTLEPIKTQTLMIRFIPNLKTFRFLCYRVSISFYFEFLSPLLILIFFLLLLYIHNFLFFSFLYCFLNFVANFFNKDGCEIGAQVARENSTTIFSINNSSIYLIINKRYTVLI